MKYLRRIRKTFVRQLGSNDCGIACVCMILKYSGKEAEAGLLRATNTYGDLSLLDLRNFAGKYALQGRCVEMDMEFLSTNLKPCILHLSNEQNGYHFQVCYGRDNRQGVNQYLMADPARGTYFIGEEDLSTIWLSRAALYFEGLNESPQKQKPSSWHLLFFGQLIPTGLLLSIPLLSIFTAILGVAWSWALQRGIYSSLAERESRLIEWMIFLLFVVTLAKNLFSYIRQQLMIRLNIVVNRHLTVNFMRTVINRSQAQMNSKDPAYFKHGMSSMMKMQQAVSSFLATILSEGSIIVLVVSALFYQSCILGLINVIYLAITVIYSMQSFPALLFDQAHLNELSGSTEKFILKDMALWHDDRPEKEFDLIYDFHEGNHSKYLAYARQVSTGMSRSSFIIDCIGTCSVICVFIHGILRMRDMDLSYSGFMISVILSYFITAMMPKVCSAMFVVIDGIESSRHYPVTKVL